DFHVTGVQTCALPILNRRTSPRAPDSTSRDAVRKSPSQRRLWNGNTGRPRTALSAASDRASAAEAATGLSTTTGTPDVSAVLAKIGRAACRERGRTSG